MNDSASEHPENEGLFSEMAQQVITATYNKGFAAGHAAGYTEGLNAARSALANIEVPALVDITKLGGVSLDTPIGDLNLTVRTHNFLAREGITTLRHLTNTTESQLFDVRNFGDKSMDEVRMKLADFGLSLKE